MIGDEASQYILLAFGLIAVGVHAYGMYNTPLSDDSAPGHYSLLNIVSTSDLGGRRAFLTGFLCHLVILELLYVVVSMSSVLLEAALTLNELKKVSGASSGEGLSVDSHTPIIAAIAIITLSRVPPFAQIERAVRRMALHVGGIPDSTFDIINKIHKFDWIQKLEGKAKANGSPISVATQVRIAAKKCGADKSFSESLESSIAALLSLNNWTRGSDADRTWSSQNLHLRTAAAQSIGPTVESFELKLSTLLQEYEGTNTEDERNALLERWRSLDQTAHVARKELASLFALLLVNQPNVRTEDEDLSEFLQLLREKEENPEFNYLLYATVFGGIGVFISFVLVYFFSDQLRGGSPNYDLVDHLRLAARPAVYDTIDALIIFGVASSVALSLRATKMTAENWRIGVPAARSKADDVIGPISQYLTVGLFSALAGFCVLILYTYGRQLVISSPGVIEFKLSESLVETFRSQLPEIFSKSIICILCAMAVCKIADFRDSSKNGGVKKKWIECLKVAAVIGGYQFFLVLLFHIDSSQDGVGDKVLVLAEAFIGQTLCYLLLLSKFSRLNIQTGEVLAYASRTFARIRGSKRSSDASVASIALCIGFLALQLTFLVTPSAQAQAVDRGSDGTAVIRLGVRSDAAPFASVTKAENSKEIVFSGYMYTLCRAVLEDVLATKQFNGYTIENVPTNADTILTALDDDSVDVACGPTSITAKRLQLYSVTQPVFLSGISIASLDRFPRSIGYCKGVVAVVRNTTAVPGGIAALAKRNRFGLYNEVIAAKLRADPNLENPSIDKEVTSRTCPTGYEESIVQQFNSHDDAANALCNGSVLFYVGDVDILQSQIFTNNLGCSADVERSTVTRELYGVYFRSFQLPKAEPLQSMENIVFDFALKSAFDTQLSLRLQEKRNIFITSFEESFPGRQMSRELQGFFDSFRSGDI